MITIAVMLLYLVQMLCCLIIHHMMHTRLPEGVWDFIKLTFLPYVLYKLYKKEDL